MNQKALEAAAKNKLIMGIAEQVSESFKFYLPFWSDNRMLYSRPELLKIIAHEAGKEILNLKKKGLEIDCLIAIPHIGIPLAYAISLETGIKAFYVQKEKKKFLRQTFVQGDFNKGDSAVLIDDILGVGKTKDVMIKNAQKDGLKIKHIFCMANAFPAKNKNKIADWTKKGIGCSWLFTRHELMDYLLQSGRIAKDAYDVHNAYAADPAGWIKNKDILEKFNQWKKSTGIKTIETF